MLPLPGRLRAQVESALLHTQTYKGKEKKGNNRKQRAESQGAPLLQDSERHLQAMMLLPKMQIKIDMGSSERETDRQNREQWEK